MAGKTKTHHQGFNFTNQARHLVSDVVQRVPQLSHVDVGRVAFAFSQTRKPVLYGIQASLTPLRFEDGARTGFHRGRKMTVQQVLDAAGTEMLYILTFYLPRFQNLDFKEKITTVFHELWHISPAFDGDIRRHPGRCYAHTRSEAEFEAQLQPLVADYLAQASAARHTWFLRLNFAELQSQFGGIYGTRIPRPKLIPVSDLRRHA